MLLQEEIERKRKEMIDCAQQYGISSHLTISKSQELDILILRVLKMKRERKN